MKPNIIFYFSDQQRYDTLGCCGQKLPVTPCLDAFAQSGEIFDGAFTCQPVCGPARSCLQSGVYATQTGCFRNNIALPVGSKTIADYLSAEGYDTAYVGKWHLASDDNCNLKTKAVPAERRGGYRFWRAADVLEFTSHGKNGYVYNEEGKRLDFKGRRVDRITDYAIDYIKNDTVRGDKPFFLFLSHLEPHHQNDRLRFEAPSGTAKNFKNYDVPGDLEGTLGDWRLQMPSYLACCNAVDRNFGRVVAALKEEGLWDNSIVIFSSDHGCHFRTRNAEYKRSCHDNSIHIPLIIGGGAYERRGRRQGLVSLLDIPATILDAAGIPVPSHYGGRSLLDGSVRKSVYVQISESQTGRAVRTDRWKYSVSAKNTGTAHADRYKEEFLYDLEKDPHERHNLIGSPEYREVCDELAALIKRYMKEACEPDAEIIKA